MVSALLFTYASTALLLTANALRRLRRPRAFFPPLWLPAMITTELAPLWMVVTIAVGAGLSVLGGLELAMGRIGLAMLGLALVGLGIVSLRSRRALERLPEPTVPEYTERGRARLLGRPLDTPDDVEEQAAIPYHGGHTLDLIRLRDAGPGQPAFVYVHGGGWTGGDPHTQARRMYHTLARAGWTVATIRYPLAPEAGIDEQARAVKAAIHHLRSGSDRYGIDGSRIVVSGGSAGGHLASLAALAPAPAFQEGFEDADVSVAACIPIYGIYDMVNRNHTRRDWPYVDRDVMKGSYGERPDDFHRASPLDYVRTDAPPFLVVHGTHDSLVPIEESEVFVRALEQAGAQVDHLRVPGAQHGFDAVSSPVSRRVAAVVASWAGMTVGAAAPVEIDVR